MSQAPKFDPFSKPFAWSYSKLKNYETCPKRTYHLDWMRDVKEPESDALLWGNTLHDVLAKAIGADDNDQRNPRDMIDYAPLPEAYAPYKPWVDRITGARAHGAQVIAEKGLAINREFKPTAWFDSNSWFRAKIDAMVIAKDGQHAATWDWKTGNKVDDSPQLMMSAITMFARYPSLQAIRAEFVWLKGYNPTDPFNADHYTRKTYTRQGMGDMWSSIAPRVERLSRAYTSRDFPANPSGLCKKWCPVTSCPHNGKGSR